MSVWTQKGEFASQIVGVKGKEYCSTVLQYCTVGCRAVHIEQCTAVYRAVQCAKLCSVQNRAVCKIVQCAKLCCVQSRAVCKIVQYSEPCSSDIKAVDSSQFCNRRTLCCSVCRSLQSTAQFWDQASYVSLHSSPLGSWPMQFLFYLKPLWIAKYAKLHLKILVGIKAIGMTIH